MDLKIVERWLKKDREKLIDEARARRFAAVLIDSNDAITIHDLQGKITAWNRGAEQSKEP